MAAAPTPVLGPITFNFGPPTSVMVTSPMVFPGAALHQPFWITTPHMQVGAGTTLQMRTVYGGLAQVASPVQQPGDKGTSLLDREAA